MQEAVHPFLNSHVVLEPQNDMSESMGSVPRLHQLSQNLIKLSEFVELDELIILV